LAQLRRRSTAMNKIKENFKLQIKTVIVTINTVDVASITRCK